MANAKLGTKAVGSIVKLKVNGTAKEFIVVHQGKPSSLYDESCNGTWLLMKTCYEKREWDDEEGNNYGGSPIHTYLNGTFLNLFDSNIRNIIKQVKIPYRKDGGSIGTDQSGANGLSCKIFLLSAYELGWTTSNYNSKVPIDGDKLDYFVAGSDGNSKRIANYNGTATNWWMRSPTTDSANLVYCTISNGYMGYDNASSEIGIRPALVLPPDMEVDSSGNVVMPIGTHKTLINGTVYDVTGGKCLVNGTAYSIKKGLALVDGTETEIKFQNGYTWVIKEEPTMPIASAYFEYAVAFVSNGETFSRFYLGGKRQDYFGLFYGNKYIYNPMDGWTNQAYRTITFEEEPTGDLLTWLQANAVQQ